MYFRSRGREEPYGPLSDLGPLVLVPGVVEERDLHRSGALRQFGEAFGEGLVNYAWQRAAGIYACEGGGMAGGGGFFGGGVEGGEQRRKGGVPGGGGRPPPAGG